MIPPALLISIKIHIIKKIKPKKPISSIIAKGRTPFSIGAENYILKYIVFIDKGSDAIPNPIPKIVFSKILDIIGSYNTSLDILYATNILLLLNCSVLVM